MITFSFWFFFLGYSYDTILIVFGITTYWYFVPCLVFFPELPGMLPESPTCARTRTNWPSPKAQMFSKSTWINTLWYSLINEESFSVLTSIFLPELGFCWISPVPSEYQSEGCGMGQKKRYRSTKKTTYQNIILTQNHVDSTGHPEINRNFWQGISVLGRTHPNLQCLIALHQFSDMAKPSRKMIVPYSSTNFLWVEWFSSHLYQGGPPRSGAALTVQRPGSRSWTPRRAAPTTPCGTTRCVRSSWPLMRNGCRILRAPTIPSRLLGRRWEGGRWSPGAREKGHPTSEFGRNFS